MSGEVQSIVDVTLASAEPTPLDPAQRYAVVVPDGGSVKTIDPAADHLLEAPRRAAGISTVYDVESLGYLWDKHAVPTSELFADDKAHTITAVLNADLGAGLAAGFRDHRVVFQSILTPAWNTWMALDGKMLDQQVFAEHIEDRSVDVVRPTGAEMLELASTFEATTRMEFKEATNLGSGQKQLRYEETVQARSGQTGTIEIPTTFDVALQPFEGGDAYKVVARFRYRINGGKLALGFKFERPEDVLRKAFTDRMDAVAEATSQTVLRGAAPGPR